MPSLPWGAVALFAASTASRLVWCAFGTQVRCGLRTARIAGVGILERPGSIGCYAMVMRVIDAQGKRALAALCAFRMPVRSIQLPAAVAIDQ